MTLITNTGQGIATPDGWLRWDCTNLTSAGPFESLNEKRESRTGLAWLIPPEEGADWVHFGMVHIDRATGPRPRRLELRCGRPGSRQARGGRGPASLAGPDGPIVRALDCEAGLAIDSREGSGVRGRELFDGGIYIALIAEPGAQVSFHVLYRQRSVK